MGDIMKTLFGGSDSKNTSTQSSTSNSNSSQMSQSKSGNNAFGMMKDAYGGVMNMGNSAFGQMGALLGVGGDKAAAEQGMNNYMDSSGLNFIMDQGSKAITNNAAVRGTMKSGATGKGLINFGQNVGKSFFNNYLDRLGGLFSGGLQGGGLISGAGNFSDSYSQGSSNANSQSQGSSSGNSDTRGGIIPGLFG